MNQRSCNTKKKHFVVRLAERDSEKLKTYARESGITRPVALRRLIHISLQQYWNNRTVQPEVPSNQLDLFDTLQIDIFGNTTKQ